jgi:hypothetical protein
MTNTVFQCFKLYIFSISYQQAVVVKHWDFPNTEISCLKMMLQVFFPLCSLESP